MKKTLLMAAVLVMAACGEKKADTPAVDTTSAVTPAPEPMVHDTTMTMDSTTPTTSDTTVARDTAAAH